MGTRIRITSAKGYVSSFVIGNGKAVVNAIGLGA